MDWSSLSIPSNLYKVHLNDDTVSSVDTDDEVVFDDDFDTSIQNEDINAPNCPKLMPEEDATSH